MISSVTVKGDGDGDGGFRMLMRFPIYISRKEEKEFGGEEGAGKISLIYNNTNDFG